MHSENNMRNKTTAYDSNFENYILRENGNIPLILTAPHSGAIRYPGLRVRSKTDSPSFSIAHDLNTDVLTLETTDILLHQFGAKPYTLIPKIHRKYVDLNRPKTYSSNCQLGKMFYDEYHHTLSQMIKEVKEKWKKGLLIDVHGQKANRFVIYRGTNDGLTVSRLLYHFGWKALDGPCGIFGVLKDRGYHIHPQSTSGAPEDPRFNGGFTVQKYGSHRRSGIDAIQIEFGSALRNIRSVHQTADDFSFALKVFGDHFL